MKDGVYAVTDYEIEIAALTDRGLVRPSNEDCFMVLQDLAPPSQYLALAGVFDGVGGRFTVVGPAPRRRSTWLSLSATHPCLLPLDGRRMSNWKNLCRSYIID